MKRVAFTETNEETTHLVRLRIWMSSSLNLVRRKRPEGLSAWEPLRPTSDEAIQSCGWQWFCDDLRRPADG